MSNLLKSKFILGVMIASVMIVGLLATLAVAQVANAQTACSITSTLRVGSKGDQVKCLQAAVGVSADGSFGPKTKAAVVAWQASKGLTADGVFGPKSRAALSGTVTTTTPGCTTAFDPATGLPCSTTTTPVVVASGPVAVGLASSNPVAGTLVAGQATANLAQFTFTGTGTVTGVTLQRLGVSADSTLSNLYLFDGATRLTDAASVSSNGKVTFSVPAGIFTVAGSKTIAVKSDVAASTSGQTVGVMLATYTTASGVVTANLSGNVHTIATATLAAITAGTVTPTGATVNPGADITLWQSTLSISVRDVWMKRLALRQVGSAPAASLANFKLYVGGVVVGTAAGLDANGYVTFDFNAAPVLLVSGARVVRVDADVVSGASRTVQLSLRQAADVDFVDSNYGVNISPTSTPWTSAAVNTISGASGGTLTIGKDVSSPSVNVTLAGSDVNLGTFKVTAYGEPIKLETLSGGFTFTDAGVSNTAATLRNGRLLINGVQYGSTATLLAAGTSFTINYTVNPGTPVLVELHADIFDNDGTGTLDTSDTILGRIIAGSSNAQRVDSLGSFSTAASSANTLAVASASVTLSKNGNYANQDTTVPATDFRIGSYNLAGSSVEDVLLTTLTVDLPVAVGGGFDYLDVKNLYLVVKNASGVVVAQPSPLATPAASANSFSINYTLVKNANVTIDIYANLTDDGVGTIEAPDAFRTIVQVAGTSMVSGQAVTSGTASSTVAGQNIAFAASTITATRDASSPVASIVYDNQTATTATFKFASVTSAYNITNVTLTVTDATAVSSVSLYDGTTLIATAPYGASSVTFAGLAWNVPANQNKVLTVKLVLGTVGVGAGTTGSALTTAISAFTAVNNSTGVSATGSGTPTGLILNAFAAIPTITSVALQSNSLLNTVNRPLLRFTMTGNGGDIAWNLLTFKVSKDAGAKVGTDATTGVTLWDVTGGGNTSVGGVFTNGTLVFDATSALCNNDAATCDIKFVPTAEQIVSGAKTYELRATITLSTTAGDYVTVTLDNDLSSVVASTTAALILSGDTDAPISWSDLSAASHAVTTSDWTSDFGIKNLPVSDTLTSPL